MSGDCLLWYTVLRPGKVKCKACNLTFAKKPIRMLSHLGYEGPIGLRDRGVSLCPRLTSVVRATFLHCEGKWPPRPVVDNVDGNQTPMRILHVLIGRGTWQSTQEDSCPVSTSLVCADLEVNLTTETSNNCETPRASSNRPHRPSTLPNSFEEANKCKLHAIWTNFFLRPIYHFL